MFATWRRVVSFMYLGCYTPEKQLTELWSSAGLRMPITPTFGWFWQSKSDLIFGLWWEFIIRFFTRKITCRHVAVMICATRVNMQIPDSTVTSLYDKLSQLSYKPELSTPSFQLLIDIYPQNFRTTKFKSPGKGVEAFCITESYCSNSSSIVCQSS